MIACSAIFAPIHLALNPIQLEDQIMGNHAPIHRMIERLQSSGFFYDYGELILQIVFIVLIIGITISIAINLKRMGN
jgi:hypothetical protein